MGCPGRGRELDDAEEFIGEVASFIKELVPRSEVILLSHTGSRAYGWSTKHHDYDIHGLFHIKGYDERRQIDCFHAQPIIAGRGVDLNMWSLWHFLFVDLTYFHGETVINMSNPKHTDARFSMDEIYPLISKEFFEPREYFYKQLDEYRRYRDARSALHAYRLAILPIYFKYNGSIRINIFDAEDELRLGLEYHCRCAEAYSENKPLTDNEKDGVLKELEELGKRLVKEVEEWDRKYDRERVERVRREIWARYEA